MKNSARFPHLLNAPILRDLPHEVKIGFLDACAVKLFDEATTIFAQGDKADGMVLIAHGAVEVSFLSEEGNKSILLHSQPGQILGVIEAISDRPFAAECMAFPKTTVLFCDTALLFEQLRSRVFIRNVGVHAHEALTRDNTLKAADQFYTVEQRICMYLLHLSSQNMKFTQSQSYLANAVGCSRQTVNKEFGRLRDEGIIKQARGVVSVLDSAALRRRLAAQENG